MHGFYQITDRHAWILFEFVCKITILRCASIYIYISVSKEENNGKVQVNYVVNYVILILTTLFLSCIKIRNI